MKSLCGLIEHRPAVAAKVRRPTAAIAQPPPVLETASPGLNFPDRVASGLSLQPRIWRVDERPWLRHNVARALRSHAIELSEKIVLLRNGEQHFRAAAAKVTRP